jgi:hypothetical protein
VGHRQERAERLEETILALETSIKAATDRLGTDRPT